MKCSISSGNNVPEGLISVLMRNLFVALVLFSVSAVGAQNLADVDSLLLTPYNELTDAEKSAVDDLVSRIEDLQSETREATRDFNVSAHDSADVFFDLGRAYFYNGQVEEALTAYRDGLRLAPGSLLGQLHYAQLLLFSEQKEVAAFVLGDLLRSGNDTIAGYAEYLMATYEISDSTDFSIAVPHLEDYRIILLLIGGVPEEIVESVRARVAAEFNVGVEVHSVPIDWESLIPGREKWVSYLESYVARLEGANDPQSMMRFYSQIGVDPSDGLGADELQNIWMTMVRNTDDPMDHFLGGRYGRVDQFRADDLIEIVREFAGSLPNRERVLGVLGITDLDIYHDDSNYLFAFRNGKYGIMSSHRFMTPNTSYLQILERLSIQAMTSVVHILGIPRANRFPCATAYPHSLAEFDLKEDRLCPEVLTALAERYEGLAVSHQ